ncbi:gamma-glutamyl-gamma-aminobutyrate hydrolase family protein [Planctobacterium marinum]|uniref:Glutamine amidotransferase n=1 Tax=Planctobacterium marinum TaxID=1631968 RepID=A0AA48HTK5_9ALTE|nr:hypothetical protein MACH26_39780 [Planctobacterium marinum]
METAHFEATKSDRPVIAVTGPDKGGNIAWLCTALGVHLAGGKAIRVRPGSQPDNTSFQGLIIGGGSDIHPSNRKAVPLPDAKRSLWTRIKEAILFPMEALTTWTKGKHDKARDDMETRLIKYALKHKKPILGICRGHQLLNAVLGGTIFTNTLPLIGDRPRIRSPFPRKKVIYAKEGTLLEDIIGDEPIKVNAIHSQAVARTGKNLEIAAKEKSDIIQAVEASDNKQVLGVQWHPEYLFYMPEQRNLFKWLTGAAKHANE